MPCAKRAWHAGASSWRGRARCNDFSIGIELEGTERRAVRGRAVRGARGVDARARRRAIRSRDIVGHSDIAPGRKTDPGPQLRLGALPRLAPEQACASAVDGSERQCAAAPSARRGSSSPEATGLHKFCAQQSAAYACCSCFATGFKKIVKSYCVPQNAPLEFVQNRR